MDRRRLVDRLESVVVRGILRVARHIPRELCGLKGPEGGWSREVGVSAQTTGAGLHRTNGQPMLRKVTILRVADHPGRNADKPCPETETIG